MADILMSRATVGLVDYQAGNLQSIANAFEILGARAKPVVRAADFDTCSHLVLPGVGAFGFCAARLRNSGMVEPLLRWIDELGRPMLGICVGMQLLADSSDESPGVAGLGWIGGRVEKLQPARGRVRVPHVGWNSVVFDSRLGDFAAGTAADFYFDHSYACEFPDHAEVVGRSTHGRPFSAIWRRGSLLACQFHPEKSQSAGLRFLKGFIDL